MPIISPGDPLIRGLSPRISADNLPQDIEEIVKSAPNAFPRDEFRAQVQYKTALFQQQAGQLNLAGLLRNVGIPSGPTLGVFEEVTQALAVDPVQLVNDVLLERFGSSGWAGGVAGALAAISSAPRGEVIRTMLDIGVGLAIEMTATVPVVGWIIEVAYQLGKFIYTLVEIVRKDGYDTVTKSPYPPTLYEPATDAEKTDQVIGTIWASRDWTGLFSPPGLGKNEWFESDFSREYVGVGEKKMGVRITSSNLTNGTLGMVPGTGTLHRQVWIGGPNGNIDTGSIIAPGAQRMLYQLWRHIMGRGTSKYSFTFPSMFCVDATGLANSWGSYIGSLHRWVYETEAIDESHKRSLLKMYNETEAGPVFGWGTSLKPSKNEEDGYHPVRQANALRARQFAALDTIMCAYVDPNMAALRNADLRDRWDQRRRQLLEHPARCKVDLANVPDYLYREELIARGARAGMCAVYSTNIASGPFGSKEPPRAPGLRPGGKPEGSGNGGVVGMGGGERARSEGSTLLVLGALAAGGYIAHRKGLLRWPG